MAFTTVIDNEAEEIFIDLSPPTKKELTKELNIFGKNLGKENTLLLTDIQKFVTERPNMSKKRIIELLEDQKKNLAGLFNSYEKNILKQARFLSYNIQQTMATDIIAEELGYTKKTRYMWQGVFVKKCPTCIELHGTVHTMAQWDSLGHPKSYPTLCNGNCHCILVPIESTPSKAEVRKPIMVEADRIRRTEIKRGKKYSPSYKSQIIGNLRNEEFRKTMQDLRKVKKVKSLRVI